MWALRRALGAAAHTRACRWYSVQVVVPPLGDSISDGTIASVLKRAGDAVAENEVIAQIETDKVTIDIKAPSDGTVLGIVVQEQDTVVPGQLVATLDDAAAKANHIGAAPAASQAANAAAAPPAAAAAAAAPAAAAAAAAPAAHAGSSARVPGIRFPPRRTADGQRVSLLPAAEATAIVQQWRASLSSAPGAAAVAAAPLPLQAAAPPRPAAAFGQATPAAHVSPSKFATGVTVLRGMPARRELTEREMELIELGGAA